MGIRPQLRRLVGLDNERANGNTLVALIAVSGFLAWSATAAAIHLIVPFPSGSAVGGEALAAWTAGAMSPWSWPVMGIWTVTWLGAYVLAYLRVDRETLLTLPNAVWFGLSAVAFSLNFYGVYAARPELVWLPWFGVYAVGYFATGVLVERSGVYWGAGVISALLFAHGLYSVATDTGYAVLGPAETLPPNVAGFVPPGTVLMSIPFTYAVLGLLQLVPMGIDAARGGRQLTDAGIPALRGDEETDIDQGGVVPND